VDGFGFPKGNGSEVQHMLLPTFSSGALAWEAVFRLPEKEGHYYLQAFGVWTDQEGSFSDQDALWSFHLKLR
jgi:hypothetical protein